VPAAQVVSKEPVASELHMCLVETPKWFGWTSAYVLNDTLRHHSAKRPLGRGVLYVCNVQDATLNDTPLEVHEGRLMVRLTSLSFATYNPHGKGGGTFRTMGCDGGFCVSHVLIGRDKPIIGEMWVYPLTNGGYRLHFKADEKAPLRYEITNEYDLVRVPESEIEE